MALARKKQVRYDIISGEMEKVFHDIRLQHSDDFCVEFRCEISTKQVWQQKLSGNYSQTNARSDE